MPDILQPSTTLKERLEFSFKDTLDLKGFRSNINNSIISFKENEGKYTEDDFLILMQLKHVLDLVLED